MSVYIQYELAYCTTVSKTVSSVSVCNNFTVKMSEYLQILDMTEHVMVHSTQHRELFIQGDLY